MFIREVFKKSKEKKYKQHQLVESVRTPAGPRQRLVLNLGVIEIAKDKWKDLANLIENLLNNQTRLFEEEPEVESLARKCVREIIEKRLLQSKSKDTNDKSLKKRDYEEVDLNTVRGSNSRSIGAEYIALNQIELYGLGKILKKLKFDEREISLSMMLIISRLVHPSSERENSTLVG